MRTPLTALQLQLQLVERAESAAEREAAIGQLKSGLQRATHAVQQLLTLARQEPGAVEYRLAPVSLADLVRNSVVAHARLAEAKTIDLGVTEIDEAAVVSGDADALRILLDNLLDNALRYSPAGGQVDVSCGQQDSHFFLTVADSGEGIPPNERERVFDRFYRRGGEGDGVSTGSGLGLSIVRMIAERHGARVTLADSEAGGLLVRVGF